MISIRQRLSSTVLLALTFVTMTAALFLVFVYVPTERTMGVVQRIFYFHVPLAWAAFLAFFVIFICSILYLRTGNMKWHRFARSSGEIGIVFTTLVLITGPIWARPIWNAWWTWDARLTTTLMLWFIYLAYLLIGAYSPDETRSARYGAVVGLIGFIDVPIVALAIVLWRSQHPGPVIFEGGLSGAMFLTLFVSLVAFTLLYVFLLFYRTSLRQANDEVKVLKNYLDTREY